MKWSIAGLMLLGVGAAVCASIMVASLRIAPPAAANVSKAPTEIQVVVATKELSAMSIVDGRSIEVKTIPIEDAPKNAMRQPTDVVGKLLTVPVVEGQAFTSALFADEKSGARLASALKNGMRAVSVSLKPEKAGLLYPGCIVDVLVSLNRPSNEGSGVKEAMSMTLLQGVEVLAIDDVSVMSEEALAEPSKPETSTTGPMKKERKDRLVTLMVNSNQAKALQLASQYGGVSLALRNPLDSAPVETDSTMLSDLADEYTRIVAALAPPPSPPTSGATNGPALVPSANPPAIAAVADAPRIDSDAAPTSLRERSKAIHNAPVEEASMFSKPEDPKWDMIVNRSGQIEVVRFRRDQNLLPEGVTGGLSWIWEGRATSSHGGGK